MWLWSVLAVGMGFGLGIFEERAHTQWHWSFLQRQLVMIPIIFVIGNFLLWGGVH